MQVHYRAETGNFKEFQGIFTPYYTINFRGGVKVVVHVLQWHHLVWRHWQSDKVWLRSDLKLVLLHLHECKLNKLSDESHIDFHGIWAFANNLAPRALIMYSFIRRLGLWVTSLFNIDLDKSCEPCELMIGNHEVVQ